MVSSSMFAKHTRNQPASWQWNEHPGDTFSFISLIIIFHSSNSAANVGSLRRFLKFIHTNSPSLLSRVSIPTWASPRVKLSCLLLSLSELCLMKFPTNSWLTLQQSVSCNAPSPSPVEDTVEEVEGRVQSCIIEEMNYGYAVTQDLPQMPLDMLPEIEKVEGRVESCINEEMNYGYAVTIDLPQKPLDMLPEIEKACRSRTNCALLGKGC
nr:1-aminocyclopropane-1-carboxylic acid synthase [Ipomoea batatas]